MFLLCSRSETSHGSTGTTGQTCLRDHSRKSSLRCVFLFCTGTTFKVVTCPRLLPHTSPSPLSLSYKTTVSTLPVCVRGSFTCFLSRRYRKADRKKKRWIFLCAKADTLQYCQKCSESTGWEEKAQDNTIRRIYENSRLTVTHPHSTTLLKVDHHPP